MLNPGNPAMVVFPDSKEEVQAIVRLAGEMRIPLVPIGSGLPYFHGDTVPEQSGMRPEWSDYPELNS